MASNSPKITVTTKTEITVEDHNGNKLSCSLDHTGNPVGSVTLDDGCDTTIPIALAAVETFVSAVQSARTRAQR